MKSITNISKSWHYKIDAFDADAAGTISTWLAPATNSGEHREVHDALCPASVSPSTAGFSCKISKFLS